MSTRGERAFSVTVMEQNCKPNVGRKSKNRKLRFLLRNLVPICTHAISGFHPAPLSRCDQFVCVCVSVTRRFVTAHSTEHKFDVETKDVYGKPNPKLSTVRRSKTGSCSAYGKIISN